MDDQFDRLARHVAQEAPRRRVLRGLGALTLGSLGVLGLGQAADAKSCRKRCKNNCKRRHKNRGSNKQCRKRCQNKCG